jgi:hypothetical protein
MPQYPRAHALSSLHVIDPDSVTVSMAKSVTPDHVPALTVSYGD